MIERIVLISDWYPSDDRPVAGVFVEEQAVALAERYSVTVIAPRLRQWRDRRTASRRVEVVVRRGITVVRVDAVPALPRTPWLVHSAHAEAVRRAYGAVVEKTQRPDLVHAHVVRHAGLSALALGQRERLPVVLTEHSGPFSVHLRHAFDRRRVIRGLPRFHAVVAVSPSLQAQVAAVTDARIDVVGNVIDTDFFSPDDAGASAVSNGPFRLLSVALLTAEKRMDLVIDAVARCARTIGPVALRILGDGPEREALEQLVADRSLGRAVQFAGLADRRAVRDEMRRANAFLLASDSETFGVVVAEAMSCGLPVISTRSGGPDHIIEPGTGLLVEPGDVDGFADAIGRLMRKSGIVNGAAARASIVRRFGRAAFLRDLGEVYERAAAEGSRG